MRNGIRSLWDFRAGGWGGKDDEAAPSATDETPGNGNASFDDVQENIGAQIQARLEAGHSPGRIAMYLEQVRPGLGRALLSDLQRAARSGPGGSASEVATPLQEAGVNGLQIHRDDGYASPQFRDVPERNPAIGGSQQLDPPFAASGAGSIARAAAGKPPLAGSASSGEVDETPPLAVDEVPAAGSASYDQVQENIGDEIQARLDARHSPGRIAMDLEHVRPGLGRALLGQIQQAAQMRSDQANGGGADPRGFNGFVPNAFGVSRAVVPSRFADPRGQSAVGARWDSNEVSPDRPEGMSGFAQLSRASLPRPIQSNGGMGVDMRAPSLRHTEALYAPNDQEAHARGLPVGMNGSFQPVSHAVAYRQMGYRPVQDSNAEPKIGIAQARGNIGSVKQASAGEPAGIQSRQRQNPARAAQPSTTKGDRPYELNEGIVITPGISDDVNELASGFYQATGAKFRVSSTYRDPTRQAAAMYTNWAAGRDPGYRNKKLRDEAYAPFKQGQAEKWSSQKTIGEIAKVLTDQVKRGDYLSDHMIDRAIDISRRGLTSAQEQEILRRARAMGAVAKIEDKFHIHIQFKAKPTRS
jgi:hypothetical protein